VDDAADGKGNVMYRFVTRGMMLTLIDALRNVGCGVWDRGRIKLIARDCDKGVIREARLAR
jgi:hypothetical protein